MVATPNTPRRSKRFQPVAWSPTKSSRTKKASTSTAATVQWLGEPSDTRAFDPEHDLMAEERETWDARQNQDGGDEELQTRVYDAFEKRKTAPAKGRKKSADEGRSREVYRVGDTILVSTYSMLVGQRAPSAAVIVGLWDTDFVPADGKDHPPEDRMRVRIHWFLRPTELASIRAKREHLADEIYYSVNGSEVLTPEAIISHCSISTARPSTKTDPAPKRAKGWAYVPVPPPKQESDSDSDGDDEGEDDDNTDNNHGATGETGIALKGKLFRCFHAVDSRRGIFGAFDWVAHRERALAASSSSNASGEAWNVVIQDESRKRPGPKPATASKARREGREAKEEDSPEESEDSGEEYEHDSSDEEEDDELPALEQSESEGEEGDTVGSDEEFQGKRGKRKRSGSITRTPRKRARTTVAHPTPHSKKALSRGKRGRKPKGLDASPSKSPRKRAFAMRMPQTYSATSKAALEKLPKDPWLRAMHVLHVGSRPNGAGALKCREEEFSEILREVGELIEEGSGGCVYISGVPGTGKTATVHAVVRELKRMAEQSEISPFNYVEINGLRIPEPSAAYTLLHEGISGITGSKMSSKESLKALTRHFSGAARGPEGHACVVLMDELDQLFSGHKQEVVYNFFNWPTIKNSKLVVIAVANTMNLPEKVLEGRVRSRLGMTRINFAPYKTPQLAEIVRDRLDSVKIAGDPEASKEVLAFDSIKLAAMKVGNISGDARRVLDICRRAVEIASQDRRAAKASDINEVMRIMQNSPTAAYLRDCTFAERVMLASMLKCIKRDGVYNIPWGDIQYQHLVYTPVLTMASRARQLTAYELKSVLESLVSSRALLLEDGLGAARKPEDERRFQLNMDVGEVERVLAEVGGGKWKSIL